MNIEIRYYSKQGNTKQLADVIAKQLGITAKSISEPVESDVDILFLGGGVYAFDIDPLLKTFIKSLEPKKVKNVVVFSTAAIVKSAYGKMKQSLLEQELNVSPKEFHCPGEYKFLRKGRPNETDLNNAKQFAKSVLE